LDAYFSADVETDGPIPGPFSVLSFALVFAGTYDGHAFKRPIDYSRGFYAELKPISQNFEQEALAVNGMDRDLLLNTGQAPQEAMSAAAEWVRSTAGYAQPVLVAYPLCFDWTFLYWYFIQYSQSGSPFGHSRCFDMKTAVSIKTGKPLSESGRNRLPSRLRSIRAHTHQAMDDAVEQAEIFANVFEWEGRVGANLGTAVQDN
jgi:Exonuclease